MPNVWAYSFLTLEPLAAFFAIRAAIALGGGVAVLVPRGRAVIDGERLFGLTMLTLLAARCVQAAGLLAVEAINGGGLWVVEMIRLVSLPRALTLASRGCSRGRSTPRPFGRVFATTSR